MKYQTVSRSLDAATVTLSEFEIKRCEKLVDAFIERRRPPARLRKEVDLAFRIKGQSVEIFEIRASWTGTGQAHRTPDCKGDLQQEQLQLEDFSV